MSRYDDFEHELADLINKHSLESGSDTPDYILASYLVDCLDAWETASQRRGAWFKNSPPKVGEAPRP